MENHMEITEIKEIIKKNRYGSEKKEYQIFIDGNYSFTLDEESYLREAIYDAKELLPEKVEYIKQNIVKRAAKTKALNYLSLRYCTSRQLEEKLASEGISEDISVEVINDLKGMGYINDRLFAQKYISDRLKLKPKSKKALTYELLTKGVGTDIINEVLDDYELDETDIALRLVKKKFGKYKLDEKIKRKIYSFLVHRGFSVEVYNDIIKLYKA